MEELIFNVYQEPDGGFYASVPGTGLVTQGDTWEELSWMALDATRAYFYDSEAPKRIRLFLHVEQVLAVA